MSETEAKTQGQKPKISRLAIASMVVAVFGVIIGIVRVYKFTWCPSLPSSLNGKILLTGFILGIVALAKMGVSKRKLRGRGFAIFSIAICFFAALVGPGIASRIQLSNRFRCSHNIVQLGRAMLYYAGHSDWRLPTQDRWCDLLVEHAEASKDIFICPGSHEEVGESSYALNENIVEVPDSGDIVLLFESIPGWNQFGGPELLSTENHNGEGCNIVFCDSHGEFVRKERLGELKWEV
jgi:hypothetical protein